MPRTLATDRVASMASATVGISADGSSWHRLPPTVPRLRVWRWPTCSAASRHSGKCCATSGENSISRWRVIAPMQTAPCSWRMYASSGTRLMSIRQSGNANRMFSIATSDWPPASTRALSCSLSNCRACGNEAGA
ncbi:Uncharacterised protein [Bordetella pertussis]|nr:Uncharacterised protein [Bordetella pertussis]CFO33390.1 Uncharacterised protein [Bordetella pertussis]CFP01006.1 Uncharacterised protein [Bordetella pertussis]CFP09897.1 Uncharacterised protein [Bordetella pertussis]CFP46352.1 Uncharacterised protein [Bordetella pertussis]